MRIKLLLVAFCIVNVLFAQKQNTVLLTINDKPITVSEFKYVYDKNKDIILDKASKNIDNYLTLFIDYKLKVAEAHELNLDKSKAYNDVIADYKKRLLTSYLQDKDYLDKLVKQAYFRIKNEVKAKHILVRFHDNMQPSDTLALYNKILGYRNRILAGESFEKVAKEVSEDPSAKVNGGDLGYFTAFEMVYPFENAAYQTKVGQVSMPFKTRFGYHIIKVNDMRPSKGEFQVAQILVSDKSNTGKAIIDSAYAALQAGEQFKSVVSKFSTDEGSISKGGILPRFRIGTMVKEFENAVLTLDKEGAYSKPFKTKYGWHIVKLVKNYPILSFDEMKDKLMHQVKNSDRSKLYRKEALKRLKKQYSIKVNKEALAEFKNPYKTFLKDNLQATLLTINNKEIKQEAFYNYYKGSQKPIDYLFEKFKDNQILVYFENDLENTSPTYKHALQEFKDGLLLFDLMQKKVWNKALQDTKGLEDFFAKQAKFKGEKLADVKAEAVSEYQTYLEKEWVAALQKNAHITINKKALKKLKKQYTLIK
ncbi:peptidylprolyl isomerase [Tenacibaculum sp. UWU-22]|uniref:peptidylprolyl isomerase n=1 Tax=Tenacibaculum sp. UWU-22 TaxID=3234187 RepID=UPI0034DB31CF